MHTILELLNLTTPFFEQKGIESARLNAELLLADVLKCKRLDLYLSFDKPVKDDEVDLFRSHVKRRGLREPLQYILGYVEFYGLTFSVNKNVLIPRQETEILIETVLNSIDKETHVNIMDIGTGSGIIAVALAKHLPNAEIIAVDKSPEALVVARLNADSHNVASKITYLQNDVLALSLPIAEKQDIIVSNPPYVSLNEFHTLQKEIVIHEPDFAITDFSDGLTFYRKIIASAKDYLKEKGRMYFELGAGQSVEVRSLFELHNFSAITITKDYSNIDRVIKGELK
ncbi:MAG: protein-(glutamine-N5) methyltransferase, release factor-specific [Ignavibacteria bacterium CG22_combo_CG10-13_8_21_14_all_37_15]|nr:MAG: protein-(glutamine-N5) methyltransferase, release factor-specific [Ignavibacteria bacterium CG22_combo_CG10-13_8_21_14_all_37_15]PJC59969.1 MAG: peptide chain release factor N(5)-glutamine methyltransferase [Ignavibacteria bacterium CG_4_9_14_0_2_um_filter_37_13]